ncbi:MAG: hypothetical protein ACE5H6_00240 [Dehalococcoidia bacterium]
MASTKSSVAIPGFTVGLFKVLSAIGMLALVKGALRPGAEPVMRIVARSGLLKFSPGTHALFSVLAKPGVLASVKDMPSSEVIGIIEVLAKPGVAFLVCEMTPSMVVDLVKTLALPGALVNFKEMEAEEVVHLAEYLLPSAAI